MKQFLIVLIIAVFAIDSNEASEDTVVIDFTSFDNENPPSEGIKVPMQGDSKEAQSFCVRFYVESLNNQGIFSNLILNSIWYSIWKTIWDFLSSTMTYL